jgi:hypothetical protein
MHYSGVEYVRHFFDFEANKNKPTSELNELRFWFMVGEKGVGYDTFKHL